eukprot:TRINITY_DN15724_c0_g1_i2.p1 TRINITY_DN15724_c0_g1~~TRINITY_DN15724_c0_g1_i2.p1  ORF type:complete len:235 (+),score=41.86 TRINITY_DN15724_c0_g1_i2:3-707(+)
MCIRDRYITLYLFSNMRTRYSRLYERDNMLTAVFKDECSFRLNPREYEMHKERLLCIMSRNSFVQSPAKNHSKTLSTHCSTNGKGVQWKGTKRQLEILTINNRLLKKLVSVNKRSTSSLYPSKSLPKIKSSHSSKSGERMRKENVVSNAKILDRLIKKLPPISKEKLEMDYKHSRQYFNLMRKPCKLEKLKAFIQKTREKVMFKVMNNPINNKRLYGAFDVATLGANSLKITNK